MISSTTRLWARHSSEGYRWLLEKAESGNEPRRRARRRPRRNPLPRSNQPQKKKEAQRGNPGFSAGRIGRRRPRTPSQWQTSPRFRLDSNNQQVVKWPSEIRRHPRRIWLDVPCRWDIRMGVNFDATYFIIGGMVLYIGNVGFLPRDSTGPSAISSPRQSSSHQAETTRPGPTPS